jgi:hypothetical protein
VVPLSLTPPRLHPPPKPHTQTPALQQWFSNRELLRHLSAKDYDLKKAAAAVRETARWREEQHVDALTWQEVQVEGACGKMYLALGKQTLA